jgi:hypothetical protein
VVEPMQGVPPSIESQVTMRNFPDAPMSRRAFRNAGASTAGNPDFHSKLAAARALATSLTRQVRGEGSTES